MFDLLRVAIPAKTKSMMWPSCMRTFRRLTYVGFCKPALVAHKSGPKLAVKMLASVEQLKVVKDGFVVLHFIVFIVELRLQFCILIVKLSYVLHLACTN